MVTIFYLLPLLLTTAILLDLSGVNAEKDYFEKANIAATEKLKDSNLFKRETSGMIPSNSRRGASKSAMEKARRAERMTQTARELAAATGRSTKDSFELMKRTSEYEICPPIPDCTNTSRLYRTIDGSCNNLAHPAWGMAETAFIRRLPAAYADGISVPRKSLDGSELPSARAVSTAVVNNEDHELNKLTAMVTQWGQFIDHDISFTPASGGLACCDGDTDPQCLPIEIPDDDPFYASVGQTCMEFARSLPAMHTDCIGPERQQLNQITAYIDASMVYGSDPTVAGNLRTFSGGRLIQSDRTERGLLPKASPAPAQCVSNPEPCFLAGDVRVNETPDLTTMHTIFVREHNRLVEELSNLNPHWDDEKLYQEARKIVGALMQHITYNEWLPKIIGFDYASNNGLLPNSNSYSYDPNVDSSVWNEFATVAFRYGHSMVQGILKLYDETYHPFKDIPLSSVSFAPGFLYHKNGIDEVVRGLATQKCQDTDISFTEELHNNMFSRNASFGLDLIALNTQRGREHGIPSYIKYREVCGLGTVTSFDDLIKHLGEINVANLRTAYEDVSDIDFFIGGLMETKTEKSLVGDTFKCIITDQFKRLKYGDRFHHENRDSIGSFKQGQIQSIQRVTLARIFCDNTDIQTIQQDVFVKENDRLSCTSGRIESLNLKLWKDKP